VQKRSAAVRPRVRSAVLWWRGSGENAAATVRAQPPQRASVRAGRRKRQVVQRRIAASTLHAHAVFRLRRAAEHLAPFQARPRARRRYVLSTRKDVPGPRPDAPFTSALPGKPRRREPDARPPRPSATKNDEGATGRRDRMPAVRSARLPCSRTRRLLTSCNQFPSHEVLSLMAHHSAFLFPPSSTEQQDRREENTLRHRTRQRRGLVGRAVPGGVCAENRRCGQGTRHAQN